MEIQCPKCKSKNINQFRHPTGPIWCGDCGYRVEHKERYNPFVIVENRNAQVDANDNAMMQYMLDAILTITEGGTPDDFALSFSLVREVYDLINLQNTDSEVMVRWSEPDEGYIATVSGLDGLSAFGETAHGATRELIKAWEVCLEVRDEA